MGKRSIIIIIIIVIILGAIGVSFYTLRPKSELQICINPRLKSNADNISSHLESALGYTHRFMKAYGPLRLRLSDSDLGKNRTENNQVPVFPLYDRLKLGDIFQADVDLTYRQKNVGVGFKMNIINFLTVLYEFLNYKYSYLITRDYRFEQGKDRARMLFQFLPFAPNSTWIPDDGMLPFR